VWANCFFEDAAKAFVEGDVDEVEPTSVEPGCVEASGISMLRGDGVEFNE
jgi:hypothetical protein